MNQSANQEVLQRLKNFTRRYLRSLQLKDIFGQEQGYVLDDAQQIIGLNLNSCELVGGSAIGGLSHLTHLDLCDNQLSDIRVLESLKNLTHLYLTRNRIKDISPLENLKNLQRLYLNSNPIIDYSPLKNLKNLTHLYLNSNTITDYSFIACLTNLKVLNLNGCRLSNIEFLKDLIQLTHLYLKFNQISEIIFLKDLTHLTQLDLCNNQIFSLPPAIIDLDLDIYWSDTGKPGMILTNNPIEPPPIEILAKGSLALKTYLKSLFGENQALNEVKVLLVGDGGAGKTSLVRRLCREAFRHDEPQTHGIIIKPSNIQMNRESIKIRFWDFGGQEIMHATHQFFLSERSLYILVLDGRREENPEYWLKHIESFGGDSPVLIALNKIDNSPTFDVNRRFLQTKYKNIIGFFPISCATDTGIKSFSGNLNAALKEVEMCNIKWPANWFMVKTRLETMKEKFINYERYRSLCLREKVIEPKAQDTLIDLLNDLGVVLHFKDMNLTDTHVLEPRWVTQAVYKIITSEKIKNAGGIFHITWLEEILEQKVKTEDFDYPQEKHHYIIDLMKKFELCYHMDDQKETVLIPDLLDIQKPHFDFDYDDALKLVVCYKDFLPKIVIPRLIVKMHRDIKDRLQWRTGIVLEDPSSHATAIIESDSFALKITIWVSGTRKEHYLAVIRHTLKSINDRFEKLEVDERLPLPDNPSLTVSIAHMLRLQKAGHSTIVPDGSLNVYDISELLNSLEKPNTNEEILQFLTKPHSLNREARIKIRARIELLKVENGLHKQKGNRVKKDNYIII